MLFFGFEFVSTSSLSANFEKSLYAAQYEERNAKFAHFKTTLKTTDTTKSVAKGIFYTFTKIICYY